GYEAPLRMSVRHKRTGVSRLTGASRLFYSESNEPLWPYEASRAQIRHAINAARLQRSRAESFDAARRFELELFLASTRLTDALCAPPGMLAYLCDRAERNDLAESLDRALAMLESDSDAAVGADGP